MWFSYLIDLGGGASRGIFFGGGGGQSGDIFQLKKTPCIFENVFSITCTKSTQYFKTCPLLDMPRPPSLTEMASRRGLYIFQFKTNKNDWTVFITFSFPFILFPFYLLHNYQLSVQASSCRGPLVSIMLFMLKIELQITMLVVWNDWGNQSIWAPTGRN